MPTRRSFLSSLSVALLVGALLAPTAAAAEPTVTVVAQGLDNPRGMEVGPDGALYVAEAGRGGDLACVDGPEGEACFGTSGAITKVTPTSQRRVITGLPSAADPDGNFGGGPSDISFQGIGSAYIPLNLGGDPADRAGLPAAVRASGWLVRGNVRTGTWAKVADIAGFEGANNPDGVEPPDSNPYSAATGRNGVAVVDAGGNSLLWVGANKRTRLLAVFPEETVQGPGGAMSMQAVPNSVVRGPDGAWYVGQLTGFPFPVGGAKVFRVVPGQAPEVYAEGFTNIIDLDFTLDGRLLVLELATNGMLSGDLSGRLAIVESDGSVEDVLTDGLVAPGGVTVGFSGAIFVSNFSVFAGAGQVLKIDL